MTKPEPEKPKRVRSARAVRRPETTPGETPPDDFADRPPRRVVVSDALDDALPSAQIDEATRDTLRSVATDRVLAGAAVLTIVFSLVGAAWYVGRTTAAPADIDALRAEMVDRIGDVDGDVRTLRDDTNRQLDQIRDDMNRQFDRLYNLVNGLRDAGLPADN